MHSNKLIMHSRKLIMHLACIQRNINRKKSPITMHNSGADVKSKYNPAKTNGSSEEASMDSFHTKAALSLFLSLSLEKGANKKPRRVITRAHTHEYISAYQRRRSRPESFMALPSPPETRAAPFTKPSLRVSVHVNNEGSRPLWA